MSDKLLFKDAEWDFTMLDRVFDAVEEIALNDLGLETYPNQVEIISSEQMLDAYSAHGMPLMYNHWSFGKVFAREETMYQKGHMGLAYEIVINSIPCISFLMEENTMTMQTLVMAHACFGHNHFFKNNYLFQQWTDAEGILDYLAFAKRYITTCEEKYGFEEVETILDSAHAIMDQGVFRYQRPPRLSDEEQMTRIRERLAYDEANFNDLWRTLPNAEGESAAAPDAMSPVETMVEEDKVRMKLPEENLLYFLEKHSPILRPWQRELLRIVRNVSQYFYPQKQTKVMNEGCATFVHHYIMQELHKRGQINDGALLEFLHSHSSVIFQPAFDDQRYSGFNPYALGFAMMEDIKRICEEPTEEDLHFFPSFAGTGKWREELKYAWANFRDESFIQQYLSPKVMRDFRLFAIHDSSEAPNYLVSAIHDEAGFRKVRNELARMFDIGQLEPNLQVVEANVRGNRKLNLQHAMHQGVPLDEKLRKKVMVHIERLWGHEVEFSTIDAADLAA